MLPVAHFPIGPILRAGESWALPREDKVSSGSFQKLYSFLSIWVYPHLMPRVFLPNLRRYRDKRPDFRLALGFLKFARVATPLPAPQSSARGIRAALNTDPWALRTVAVARLQSSDPGHVTTRSPTVRVARGRGLGRRERCERNLSPFGSSRCCAVQCHSVDDPPLSGKVPVRCFFASCTRVVFNRLESYRQNCSAEDRWCVP